MPHVYSLGGEQLMTDFPGLRVLVVEDEAPVAMMIEDMLEEMGCEILASIASVSEAAAFAAQAEIDFAMLDVNVAGERVFPVAEILRERHVPFLFSTGYGTAGLPEDFSASPVLAKPFSREGLREQVALALKD